ncbi:MAG: hypothetical protein DRJ56_00390 [Thermoprotei archaeon]|nr:MAG: hypothetical protein DRJ56_00390 [Thermoprotei archaeon]
MEELVVVFAVLTAATAAALCVLASWRPAPTLDVVALHLAIAEAVSSPVNEVVVVVAVPRGVEVILEGSSVTVRGALVDPRVLAFNHTGILRGVTVHAVEYDPSKVQFESVVVLTGVTTVRLVHRFGVIRVMPVGGRGP